MSKVAEAEAPAGRLKIHHSIAWAALAKHADKECERSSLPVGMHTVELEVSGKAGGRVFKVSIDGTLSVAPDGVRDVSEKAPLEQVIAWLLAKLCDDQQRAKILNELPAVWSKELPLLPAAAVDQAKEMLARLRTRTGTTHMYGAVKFTPTV